MAIINQSNILNLQPGITAPVVVHMSEGDSGTKLSFKLIDGARAWTDPGNVVAAVHGRRQDGAQFGPYACSISGDVVSFETNAAMAARAGAGLAEIVLTDSHGNTAGSANFAIMVERATFPMGVTYTNDVSVYEAILAYVQTIPAEVTEDYVARINSEAEARATADELLAAQTMSLQTQISDESNTRAQQDIVLSARMDEFSQLPSGSTSGNAELVDIRVMTDGQTAPNAGDAVREQIDRINGFSSVESIALTSGQYIALTGVGNVVDTDNPIANANYAYAVLACEPGDTYTVTGDGTSTTRVWGFLDSTKTAIILALSGISSSNTVITAPKNAAYLVLNIRNGFAFKGYIPGKLLDVTQESYVEVLDQNDRFVKYWDGNPIGTARNVFVRRDINVITLHGATSNSLYMKWSGDLIATSSSGASTWVGDISLKKGHTYKLLVKKVGGSISNSGSTNLQINIRSTDEPRETITNSIIIEDDSFTEASETFIWNKESTNLCYINAFGGKTLTYVNYQLYVQIIDMTEYATVAEQAYELSTPWSGYSRSGSQRNLYIPFAFQKGETYKISIDFAEITAAETSWKYFTEITPEATSETYYNREVEQTAPVSGDTYAREFAAEEYASYLHVAIYTLAESKWDISVTISAKTICEQYKRPNYISTDIDDDNHYTDILSQIKTPARYGTTALATPLSLLWFTDLHADAANFIRVMNFREKYIGWFDDTLFSGDLVETVANGLGWFNAFDGHEDILLGIGNHELYDASYATPYTRKETYDMFFAPYISNWGVTQPANASTQGLCYWYKDYSINNTRIIMLDCMHWDADQLAWLEATLASAKANDFAVVCVSHYMPGEITPFDTPFCSAMTPSRQSGNYLDDAAATAVDAFITGGGEFICWLSGHTHRDFTGTITAHPNQISLTLACAMNSNTQLCDTNRQSSPDNQDTFNLLGIDTGDKVIKVARVGAHYDLDLRHKDTMAIRYTERKLI